jgi:hypothetical protein
VFLVETRVQHAAPDELIIIDELTLHMTSAIKKDKSHVSFRMRRYVQEALAEPSPPAAPRRLLHVLDLSGLGLSSLAGLPDVILDNAHVVDAQHNDKLFHFYGLPSMRQLLVLDVRHCKVTTFAGASLQPQLAHLLMHGSPLAMHPQVRIMAALAFGPTLKTVDGVDVSPEEHRAATQLGGSGSHAAMCVALGLTSLDIPRTHSKEGGDEYFLQLAIVLKERFLHDAREHIDKLHTLDAVMRRLHPTPSRGTPWMLPPNRWRELSEEEVTTLCQGPTGLNSSAMPSAAVAPNGLNASSTPGTPDARLETGRLLVIDSSSRNAGSPSHRLEMEQWKAAQWDRVVTARNEKNVAAVKTGAASEQRPLTMSPSLVGSVSTPEHSTDKLTRRAAANASSKPRSAVGALCRPAVQSLPIPLNVAEHDQKASMRTSAHFDDVSLILRGHPWSISGETVMEDVLLAVVSAHSLVDRELRFFKPLRTPHAANRASVLLKALPSRWAEKLGDFGAPMLTITRGDVDDVQFIAGNHLDGGTTDTFPQVAHVQVCLKRRAEGSEVRYPLEEATPMWASIAIVPMVSATSPSSYSHATRRAEGIFAALLTWCCSDAERSLLSQQERCL